jgi:DNA polymerase zeta
MGYEVQMSSLGYLVDRGKALGLDVAALLSRMPSKPTVESPLDDYAQRHTSEIQLEGQLSTFLSTFMTVTFAGRIVLNVWRLMKHELNVRNYDFETIIYHVLHYRTPRFPHDVLCKWFQDSRDAWRTCRYWMTRALGSLQVLNALNLIGRTSEFARLYGTLFEEVISRGAVGESVFLPVTHCRFTV